MTSKIYEYMSCENHELYIVQCNEHGDFWETIPLTKSEDNSMSPTVVVGGDYFTPKGCSGLTWHQAMAVAHSYIAMGEAMGEKKKVRIEKLLLNYTWELKHTDQFTEVE